MLDKLPHDVLVHLARSFEVVDRVVLSEVCRACRDATREALAVDRRLGTRADSHGDQEWGPPGDREHLALRSVSRLTWAREHGLKLETWGPRMLLRYAAELGNVELLNELPLRLRPQESAVLARVGELCERVRGLVIQSPLDYGGLSDDEAAAAIQRIYRERGANPYLAPLIS